MASNVSREKLLFYAAAGALGGFAAWGLSEPILGIRWVYGRDILFGALIGALISAFLASIETLSVGQLRQAARRFVVGGVIGTAGGALGLLVGEFAFDVLGGLNGRILGWGVLGIAVGLGVGAASGSPARRRNGAIGGVLGGALGGFFYQSLTTTFPQAFGRAIAIIRREGKNFIISPTGGQIFVNRQPVAGRYALKSGDRLEVGGTLFLFRERAQAAQQ